MATYKNPIENSNAILQQEQYNKVFDSLKNAGFDTYKDDDKIISAYDDGDAVREFRVSIDNDGLRFKDLHIDEKYRGKGYARKLIESALNSIEPNSNVIVENSINDEFWNHIAQKYPNYKWKI